MRSRENGRNKWIPPPEGVTEFYNDVPNGVEVLREHNDYCKACYTISRDIGVLATERALEEAEKLHIFTWNFDLVDLIDGAESGCHFCGMFSIRYFTQSFIMSGGRGFSRSTAACCSLAPRNREQSDDIKKAVETLREFSVKNPEANFTFVAEPMDYDRTTASFTRVRFSALRGKDLDMQAFSEMVMMIDIDLEFFAVKGNVATERIKRHPFNTQPGSEAAVAKAKQWIEECLHEHDECPVSAEATLPTRLIEILDNDNFAIHENRGGTEMGTYTALSYCWGGPQEFTTSTTSYSSNLQGFKLSDLPKTIQDALSLTRRLGIRYIWVDALCILQDSNEDKEREIPRMATYFKNSYVTICAASAKKSTDGFLQTRVECEKHPGSGLPFDLLRMPYLGQQGEYGEMLFRQPFPYSLAEEDIERRAWPFQERVLSPRVLNYGTWTVWQCQHHQRSHGGVDEFSFDQRTFNYRPVQALIRKGESNNTETSDAQSETSGLPGDIYDYWHQAVHAYSELDLFSTDRMAPIQAVEPLRILLGVREMTLESDKLPAIAGLASVFAQATGDEYLAGLWRKNLLYELLWSTSPNIHPQKPEERRAPSWSWASVDNDVTYDRLPPSDAGQIATVVSCSVTPFSQGSSFGRISDGLLEIEGVLTSISGDTAKKLLNQEFSGPGMDPFQGMFTPQFWDMVLLGSKKGKSNQDWEPPEKCAILPLFATENQDGKGHITQGLVLTEKEDGRFERIADFTKVNYQGLDELLEKKRRIVIV